MNKLILTLLAIALLAACSDAKIDASSQKALEASMEQVAENMNAQEKQALKQAVITIAMDKSSSAINSAMRGEHTDPQHAEKAMLAALHGKTAAEVIAYAEELKRR